MPDHIERYHLALAGEFFVAAELQRRNISAAVTYGNAKAADIVAFSRNNEKAITIEVKSTKQAKWALGSKVPEATRQPWVFVHIPNDESNSPSFFVVLQSELREILTSNDDGYNERYKAKHGVDFTNTGFISIKRTLLEPHQNKWEKIVGSLEA